MSTNGTNLPDESVFNQAVDSEAFGVDAQRMMEFLSPRIIGQERAVRHIARSIAIHGSGMSEPGGAAGVFVFAGPTGVGKTAMAEQLARFLVADIPHAPLTRVQCGKFKESHRVAELISSPPGYIGSDKVPFFDQFNVDAPHFWAKIEEMLKKDKDAREYLRRNKPDLKLTARLYEQFKQYKSVILFDEVEKAHEDLHSLLLHIIDDGELGLGDGSLVRFDNTAIILTCNVGGKHAQELLSGKSHEIGFASEDGDDGQRAKDIDEAIYHDTVDLIEQRFAPELVGRVRNEIIVFRSLTREHSAVILDGLLGKVQKQLDARAERTGTAPIRMHFGPAVKDFLLNEGVSRTYGVRPLKHTVRKYITLRIVNALDSRNLAPGDEAMFRMKDGKPEIFRKLRELPAARRVYIPPRPDGNSS